jgi:tRNA G37 N-methylase TrmD
MDFKIFTLHPDIFTSFKGNSLIARGFSQNIIDIETINWREKFGVGNYKQVDDKPFGGGSGMVLQTEPIYQALNEKNAISPLFKIPKEVEIHNRIEPNNQNFWHYKNQNTNHKKVTISLTPRGFPLNQQICEWLTKDFEEINILCGRYEGFDARVSEFVDLELSIGDFVTNGGEVPAMCLIEAVSRLVPGFITKDTSVLHDSFSSELNKYQEQEELIVGKKRLESGKTIFEVSKNNNINLFDNNFWRKNIAPSIEHPQYTRPEIWNNWQAPEVLIGGDHKKIHRWRNNWYQSEL